MARAFSIFARQGKAMTPFAIKTIEDRNGTILINYEQDIRQKEAEMGSAIQVNSPQNAYIITRLGAKAIEMGTMTNQSAKLVVKDDKGVNYRIPAGGKTGTSQNWSDAWAIGYTPYYTIAIWFGFDKGGNSLGMNVNGSTLAGPIWGDLMHEYNQGLPRRDFPRPPGIVDATVCKDSGLLPGHNCTNLVTLSFLSGTVPEERCYEHQGSSGSEYEAPHWDLPTLPDNIQRLMSRGYDNYSSEDPEIPTDYDSVLDLF
jgi:penicillin-binding protein 1A